MANTPRNTYTVTSTADAGAGSLREALASASADIAAHATSGDGGYFDAVTFAPSLTGQTITLASTLSVGSGVILDGTAGGARNITISGNRSVTVFTVPGTPAADGNSLATIQNLTIANGSAFGAQGARGTSSSPNGGRGGDAAGGIFVQGGHLSLAHDTFTNNTATGGSGGQAYNPNSAKGAGGSMGRSGNAAGAVYVEPGATVDYANGLRDSGDNSASPGFGGNAQTYSFSNDPTVTNNTTPACYTTGTLIRTACGDTPVEALAIGDVVVTASGALRPIKWIGTRRYNDRFARNNPALLPIRFAAGSLADGVPARDLRVSPKHAMFLDGVLIPAEHLVNGVTVVKETLVQDLAYVHVELDSHDVLLAEGAFSESFVDDESRGMFHNAMTFAAMYPGARRVAAVYCAPRVEDGYVLDAVRGRLAARAGLAVAAPQRFGALEGMVEGCDGALVWGWARDAAFPDAPVCLELLVDGRVVALAYADKPHGGAGPHGFAVRSPSRATAAVTVRRAADGALLAERGCEDMAPVAA